MTLKYTYNGIIVIIYVWFESLCKTNLIFGF